ncbi:MAG: RT0821/Lpp0805 family surface protein [Paracoccaceae bacterium]|nr:RT0821/Lpp0805 family surface protein [Paracoccaceae bacterium]
MRKYLVVCVTSLLLISCAPGSKKDIGAISGIIAGGAIANDLAHDSKNKRIATILGAFIGGAIGQSIGEQLDEADRAMALGAYRQALERTPSNESVAWDNPDSGNHGSFTPVRTFQANNRYCREYNQEVVIGGKKQVAYGTACRQSDGSWQIQS